LQRRLDKDTESAPATPFPKDLGKAMDDAVKVSESEMESGRAVSPGNADGFSVPDMGNLMPLVQRLGKSAGDSEDD